MRDVTRLSVENSSKSLTESSLEKRNYLAAKQGMEIRPDYIRPLVMWSSLGFLEGSVGRDTELPSTSSPAS